MYILHIISHVIYIFVAIDKFHFKNRDVIKIYKRMINLCENVEHEDTHLIMLIYVIKRSVVAKK